MARVALKGVNKKFGQVLAVDNLTLEARDKEFVVFLGPSGCGKTTSLRCIAGLESIDEGEIYIGDTLVNDLEPKERDVAMVFQNYALYPHMTVYRNMAFPLENFGFPRDEIDRRIRAAAELLQIEPLLQRKPKQLSGGQQQRVALGRAIVRNPKVFLMDEPLSNLDAKLRVYMRAELKKLQKELGVTTIYVTHDQVEAMTMADRIAIMNQGVLQQYDSPKALYSHPSNTFVAGFVGSPPINFFDCSVRDSTVLDAGEFTYPMPAAYAGLLASASSGEVVLGLRPQDVIIDGTQSGREESIQARVYTTEPMGDMAILDVKIGEILVKIVVSPDFEATEGQDLWVHFHPEKMLLFDKKSGSILA